MITLHCHAERSEASPCPSSQTLPLRKLRASAYCAQGDTRVSDTTGLRGQLAMTQRGSNQSDLMLFRGPIVFAQQGQSSRCSGCSGCSVLSDGLVVHTQQEVSW